MVRTTVLAIAILCCIGVVSAAESKVPFEVGEKWVYKHDGPRPWGRGQDKVDGDRVREVVSVKEQEKVKLWVVKETYGTYDERPRRVYVDGKRMVPKQDSGYDRSISYKPAIPYDFQALEVKKEAVFETKLDFGERSIPYKIVSKRLENETVKVPAGEFKDCHHYKNTITLVFSQDGNEMTIKTELDLWYHPKVNGIVKEIHKRGPVQFGGETREGSTATSELKSYGLKKKE